MTESRRRGDETVPLFPIEDVFYFKRYFDDREVFDELSQYYNESEYRFEVPGTALEDVQAVLEAAGLRPTLVEDFEPFLVVKKKYTDHPEVLFKRSVLKTDDGGYNVFLMQDRAAADAAVTSGATRFAGTDLAFDP